MVWRNSATAGLGINHRPHDSRRAGPSHHLDPIPAFAIAASEPQQPYTAPADWIAGARRRSRRGPGHAFPQAILPHFRWQGGSQGLALQCDQFFRAQRTREADKVWLASFHLTGVAQDWYFVMEQEAGGIANITWERFRMLCHQHFGPAFGTKHLSDVARLAFHGSVEDYIQKFQVRMAHAGHLKPLQWAHLFTGGLPDAIRMDVELQMPQDL